MPEYWRVFPWDPDSEPGDPFSPTHVPLSQHSGRFDLGFAPVLYLAEEPAHAVAEKIHRFRGGALKDHHLREFGYTLALCSFTPADDAGGSLLDLCAPTLLARYRIRPDAVAARDVAASQAVALQAHSEGFSGLRWWSSFFGEWHGVVLFLDRVGLGEIELGQPEALALDHVAVDAAAEALGMRIESAG